MSTKKQNKIAAAKTTAQELQEVKIQGVLLAEITAETSTKDLLEILKIKDNYYDFWVNAFGQRIESFNVLRIMPEDLPIRLWQFTSKRDLDLELENESLFH